MRPGARSPEELDELLEDAFVMRGADECRTLFREGALVGEANGLLDRCGEPAARALPALWRRNCTYVAGTSAVLRTRNTALVVADAGTHVVVRGRDGTWRAAISLLDLQPSTGSELT